MNHDFFEIQSNKCFRRDHAKLLIELVRGEDLLQHSTRSVAAELVVSPREVRLPSSLQFSPLPKAHLELRSSKRAPDYNAAPIQKLSE